MSKMNTKVCSSGMMDNTANQAERYTHGSDVIAELRTRATKFKTDAIVDSKFKLAKDDVVGTAVAEGCIAAVNVFLQWLDVLSVCDKKQCEDTKPNV